MTKPAPLRPVDAASVLLIDRSLDRFRVLVGKRSSKHVFMPDVYVFPGGRRDRHDSRTPVSAPLHPAAIERLLLHTPARTRQATLHGLGVAALRELHEEAGLTIGNHVSGKPGALPFLPDLSALRFFARAITPPGQSRRFDTRFFALFTDEAEIDPTAAADSHELLDLRWIDIFEQLDVDMHMITIQVLEELKRCLQEDPSLPFGTHVAFFRNHRGQVVRNTL
ncbi:8-oxo-dGTP pyrophosphatase MutT (NUDIX family) [Mycoplana sp. BE70]|uniref:NUDIX hydrolase n=1 Tax=Mycoplana sp. BE70 TaxID=2817775 RepID=UPI00285558AD|nr:NUDIX hydrolase [Mycoplana sp. BE70]MDR6759030.1 8-oxo-dGTP pyrophosphatase MutT (NUDIX family) [Mycoplana sp. BE70]